MGSEACGTPLFLSPTSGKKGIKAASGLFRPRAGVGWPMLTERLVLLIAQSPVRSQNPISSINQRLQASDLPQLRER